MSLTLSGKNANLLAAAAEEPAAATTATKATDAEKARARETYNNYLKNLANFPSKMTIDGKEYVGFSDKDFLMMSQRPRQTETTRARTPTPRFSTPRAVSGLPLRRFSIPIMPPLTGSFISPM